MTPDQFMAQYGLVGGLFVYVVVMQVVGFFTGRKADVSRQNAVTKLALKNQEALEAERDERHRQETSFRADIAAVRADFEEEKNEHEKTREKLVKAVADFDAFRTTSANLERGLNDRIELLTRRDQEKDEVIKRQQGDIDNLHKEIAKLTELLNAKTQEIAELTVLLNTKTEEGSKLTKQLSQLIHTNGELQQEKEALKQERENLQRQLAKMQEEIDDLRSKIDTLESTKTTALVISTGEMPAVKSEE